jgi:hypothetical protein
MRSLPNDLQLIGNRLGRRPLINAPIAPSKTMGITMNRSHSIIKQGLIFCSLSLAALASNAAVIFSDNFDSGTFAMAQSSAGWIDMGGVSVINTTTAKSGSYAARFHFDGGSIDTDAAAELRFDIGSAKTELWIQYDIYIPSNYVHRDAPSSDNNKFLRLWGVIYDDVEKLGFSMWPTGSGSALVPDWNTGAGIGPNGASSDNFIASGDLGKWMTVKVYVKAATASANGTLKLWKNGTLVIDNTNKLNNYAASGIHAYRYGYIFGYSNSGFTAATDILVDNVVFATSESDLAGGSTTPVVAPPMAPAIQVEVTQ